MKYKGLKLSQGKEEGRIEVDVLPSEERHKGNVLRGGSCDPDVFQQANERIKKQVVNSSKCVETACLASLGMKRPANCTDV